MNYHKILLGMLEKTSTYYNRTNSQTYMNAMVKKLARERPSNTLSPWNPDSPGWPGNPTSPCRQRRHKDKNYFKPGCLRSLISIISQVRQISMVMLQCGWGYVDIETWIRVQNKSLKISAWQSNLTFKHSAGKCAAQLVKLGLGSAKFLDFNPEEQTY